MNYINCKALELHKILEMLSAKCTVPKAKEAALSIQPKTDLFEVKNEIAKTSCALEQSIRYGTPGFYKMV